MALQVIPTIGTHFSIAWSVCLSHLCTLLKLFDRLRCHLANTLVRSNDTLCQMWVSGPQGKGRFGVQSTSQNMQLLPTYESAIVPHPCKFKIRQKWSIWWCY